jgi:hypothetical protein
MPGMEDFDGNGLVWTPLSSLLEQYAQAVTLPHVDLHTEMVRGGIIRPIGEAFGRCCMGFPVVADCTAAALFILYVDASRCCWLYGRCFILSCARS